MLLKFTTSLIVLVGDGGGKGKGVGCLCLSKMRPRAQIYLRTTRASRGRDNAHHGSTRASMVPQRNPHSTNMLIGVPTVLRRRLSAPTWVLALVHAKALRPHLFNRVRTVM